MLRIESRVVFFCHCEPKKPFSVEFIVQQCCRPKAGTREREVTNLCDFRCDLETFPDWGKLASVCSSGGVKTPVMGRVGYLKRNGREVLID